MNTPLTARRRPFTRPQLSPVENVSPHDLKPDPRNARTHPKRQINQIAAVVGQFGYFSPILIDETGTIIAGNGRHAAALQLKLRHVPVIRISGLSPTERRALALADNKIAANAGWNEQLLIEELMFLDSAGGQLGFDLELTGFDTVQIDNLLLPEESADTSTGDTVPPLSKEPPISRLGDQWLVGEHRVYCGNALDEAAYINVMDGEKARMVFTDPPYNVRIAGHVSGLGRTQHREFAMASGEMSSQRFTQFLKSTLTLSASCCLDGAIAFWCMDWRHLIELSAAAAMAGLLQKNLIVWAKTNGGMGTFYRSAHELIVPFKLGRAPHVNNFGLGGDGRYRTNVWQYPGANTFRRNRGKDLEAHPTPKPVALVADAIRDVSHRRDIVLDCFGGSGTTLIAAEKTGRRARIIELDPQYVDGIVRRWEQFTGRRAVHARTKAEFPHPPTKMSK